MEHFLEHIYKLITLVIGPILGLFAFWGKRMVKQYDDMEKRLAEVETRTAVQDTQITKIDKDITEIKEHVKTSAADQGRKLDKIIDKLTK